jgi:hypothetical protein
MQAAIVGMPPPKGKRFWVPDQGELNDIAECNVDCFFCLADARTIRDPDNNHVASLKIERTVKDWPNVRTLLQLLRNADTTDITYVVPAYRHWQAIVFTQMAKSQWDTNTDIADFIRRMPNASNVNFGDPGRYGDVYEQRSGLSLNTTAVATAKENREEFIALWSDEEREVPFQPVRAVPRVSWRKAAAALCDLRWKCRDAASISSAMQVIVDTVLVFDPAAWTKGSHVGLHIPGIMIKHGVMDVHKLIEENIELANQLFDGECEWLNGDGERALRSSALPFQLHRDGYVSLAVRDVGDPPHPMVFVGPRRPDVLAL